jgi:L-iditol 2-dehydrogenase
VRAARLHGIRDLRVDVLADPEPGPGELLVRIEACGVCPTDVRKWLIGLGDGDYPFNPGHEWVGRVEARGEAASDWKVGTRVYGDVYGGYAELALLPVEPGPWSNGAFRIDDGLPLERAIFVEPLADCLHAIRDQGRAEAGDDVIVIGAGQMGLQLVLSAAVSGAHVAAVDPIHERRALALALGAETAVAELAELPRAELVVVSVGDADLVPPAIEHAAPGGRVVLFAGFGKRGEGAIDLNRIHYEEIALVGSEWIGTPPNQRRERYAEALELLRSGRAPLERLVTARCGLDGLTAAFENQRTLRGLKTMLVPAP